MGFRVFEMYYMLEYIYIELGIMNPNFLSKEELLYELRARGISSSAGVQELRKLFRSLCFRDLPLCLDFLATVRVEELILLFENYLSELQALVNQPRSTIFSVEPRFRMRLEHFRNRLHHLEAAGTCTSSENIVLQKFHQQLDTVESGMDSAGDERAAVEEVVTPASNQENTATSEQVWSSSANRTPSFTSPMYQKLVNPFNHLVKDFPIVDGSDARKLCDFLSRALNILKISNITEPVIYEVLYPLCRGEMVEFLVHAITAKERFDVFHECVLRHFIADRQLNQLRVQKYERVQQSGETFATYFQAIRDAAAVLRVTDSEEHMVGRVIEGLTSIQRARFVFQQRPSTFAQLDQLAVVDRNTAYADQIRGAGVSGVGQRGKPDVANVDSTNVRQSARNVSIPGNRRVCYFCGKPGHVRANYFSRLSQTHRGARSNSSTF
jgi:hypothetical protein